MGAERRREPRHHRLDVRVEPGGDDEERPPSGPARVDEGLEPGPPRRATAGERGDLVAARADRGEHRLEQAAEGDLPGAVPVLGGAVALLAREVEGHRVAEILGEGGAVEVADDGPGSAHGTAFLLRAAPPPPSPRSRPAPARRGPAEPGAREQRLERGLVEAAVEPGHPAPEQHRGGRAAARPRSAAPGGSGPARGSRKATRPPDRSTRASSASAAAGSGRR